MARALSGMPDALRTAITAHPKGRRVAKLLVRALPQIQESWQSHLPWLSADGVQVHLWSGCPADPRPIFGAIAH
eukprot:14749689-Alexandrium_andersonii.AAC.1